MAKSSRKNGRAVRHREQTKSAPWLALCAITQAVRTMDLEGMTWGEIKKKFDLAPSTRLVDAGPRLTEEAEAFSWGGKEALARWKKTLPNCKRFLPNPNSPLFRRGAVVRLMPTLPSSPGMEAGTP